jgi:Phosphoenolpyruvate phosphomutase
MTRQEQKAAAFRALHAGEPFVIPNPWDPGSARMLEALGFEALATTSSDGDGLEPGSRARGDNAGPLGRVSRIGGSVWVGRG